MDKTMVKLTFQTLLVYNHIGSLGYSFVQRFTAHLI